MSHLGIFFFENCQCKRCSIDPEVKILDAEVRQWANQNYDKMSPILGNFITDIYKANQIVKE